MKYKIIVEANTKEECSNVLKLLLWTRYSHVDNIGIYVLTNINKKETKTIIRDYRKDNIGKGNYKIKKLISGFLNDLFKAKVNT